MEGLTSRKIDPKAFITPSKGKEIVWLHKAYEAYLEENQLIDQAGLIERAIEKIGEKGPGKEKKIPVLSGFPFSNLEKKLIRVLAGDSLVILPHSRPEGIPFPPRFFVPPSVSKAQRQEPKSDIENMAFLFSPEKSPGPFHDGTVSIFRSLGESNEVREVFRQILKGNVPFDDVEILVTTIDSYVPLIYEIACSLNVPLTFSTGIPTVFTRLGKALLYYLDWQAEEFPATLLSRLFTGGIRMAGRRGQQTPPDSERDV